MVEPVGIVELLELYGDCQLNEFRTIRQQWERLSSTPYQSNKALSYSVLRELMLKIHQESGGVR